MRVWISKEGKGKAPGRERGLARMLLLLLALVFGLPILDWLLPGGIGRSALVLVGAWFLAVGIKAKNPEVSSFGAVLVVLGLSLISW